MAQNNNEIMNAVYKYCSDYHRDETTAEHLTDLFVTVGAPPTAAQIKLLFNKLTGFTANIMLTGNVFVDELFNDALITALKLREPCFLDTILEAFINERKERVRIVAKYMDVCTEEAKHNTLKNFEAFTKRADMLEKAYCKRLDEVYEYAMHHVCYYETYDITNAYQAAWYILTDEHPQIVLVNGVYSAKQLKNALANTQAIDRYAMIEYRDYEEKITEQAEILHQVKTALFKIDAQMHVFHNSTELAEEGIRMGNCIATYWDNDSTSCLFSVDYKGQHMDVELMRDYGNEFEAWSVTQVLLAGNTANALTREIETTLGDACIKYNNKRRDEWIAAYKPNKEICKQANGYCADCTLRYCCPASLDYVDEDDRFDDARIDRIVNLGNDAVNEVLNRMIDGEELADIEDDLPF